MVHARFTNYDRMWMDHMRIAGVFEWSICCSWFSVTMEYLSLPVGFPLSKYAASLEKLICQHPNVILSGPLQSLFENKAADEYDGRLDPARSME